MVHSICPSRVATPFMAPMAGPKQTASVTSARLVHSARIVRQNGSGSCRTAALGLGGVGGWDLTGGGGGQRLTSSSAPVHKSTPHIAHRRGTVISCNSYSVTATSR